MVSYSLPADIHHQEVEKADYFKELYALNESSEEEEYTAGAQDTIKVQEFLQKSKQSIAEVALSVSFPACSPSTRRTQAAGKVPGIHRTHSAPGSSVSVVNETPLIRKTSLLRYDISTPPSTESSFRGKPASVKPSQAQGQQRQETHHRTVSDPLVLKHSSGINTMLRKNQKRKRESEIKLVAEKERIFLGKTFFYIPNDDIDKLRRLRISKARSYGAVWTKDFRIDVTHIIVDKGLTYESVLSYLKSDIKVDTFPEAMILVNESYPIDCIQFRTLLEPKQKLYEVVGSNESSGKQVSIVASGPDDNDGNHEQEHPKTPPREEESHEEIPETNSSLRSCTAPTVVEKPGLFMSSPPQESLVRKDFGNGDEFDKIIELAHNTRFVPLDDDDDSDNSKPGGDPDNSDDSTDRDRSPIRAVVKSSKKRKIHPKGSFNQEAFSCMKGGKGAASGPNPNDSTIKAFQELAGFYERTKDQWRNISYRKGITALRRQTRKIRSYDEAIEIRGIGDSLAKKIEEMYKRGKIAKLDFARLEPRDLILQKFIKIYGVGISQAEKWIDAGHKTLDDLAANVRLTENQKIGLAHYEDFNTRIPREEMNELADIVKMAVAKINPKVEAKIGGSYRRGAKTSGDIDFMLTKPNTTNTSELLSFLQELVSHLTNTGFLVAALAIPSAKHIDSGSKWHGACVLPPSHANPRPLWRRIDLLLVPASEWGAALIYFTGDDIFNRSMRLLASTKKMRLNQRGLYKDVMRGAGRVKLTDGNLVEGRDEKAIFHALGVPWRKPEERILN